MSDFLFAIVKFETVCLHTGINVCQTSGEGGVSESFKVEVERCDKVEMENETRHSVFP